MISRIYYYCKPILILAIYSIWLYIGISFISNDYRILFYAIPWICFITFSCIFACIIGCLIASHFYGKK